MVPLQLLSVLLCGHPPCLLPVEMKISLSSLGKASCQTPHQTLDRNRVLRHSCRVGHIHSTSPKLIGKSAAPVPHPYFLVCLLLAALWYNSMWPSGLQPPLPCPSAVIPSRLPCRFMETDSDSSASGHPCTIPQGYCLNTGNAATPCNHATSSSCLGFNYSYFQPNASQISG